MNNCFDESFSVEQNGCEDNSPQSNSKKESDFWQRNNRIITQQRSDLIQVRIGAPFNYINIQAGVHLVD